MKVINQSLLSHTQIFKERYSYWSKTRNQHSSTHRRNAHFWTLRDWIMVEPSGIEPLTSCVQGRRSPSWAMAPLSNLSFLLTATLHLSLAQSHTEVCSFTRSGVRLALSKKSVVILFKRHLKATFKRYLQTPNNWQCINKTKKDLILLLNFFLGKAFKREV